MTTRRRWRIAGAVQGVGMRPWLAREAGRRRLGGFVNNTADGVLVEIEGDDDSIDALRAALRAGGPEAASITALHEERLPPCGGGEFEIHASSALGALRVVVPRDRAPCAPCLSALRDPADRRHRYPFVSCTACGPRFTIIEALPFDRARSTMRDFALCATCTAEYGDSADPRFHAQTQACGQCGPRVWLERGGVAVTWDEAALTGAMSSLVGGGVIAVKGVGGYQLVCRAAAAPAVMRIRRWKARARKPLAVMVADLAAARALCRVSSPEATWLGSPAAPIVLLERRDGVLPHQMLAPGLDTLGVMLPASPLHQLLADDSGEPLLVTSGNRRGEPLVVSDDEARATFDGIADAILGHTRRIAHMADDSVMRLADGIPIVLRHARGLAPTEVPVAGCVQPMMALGGELKVAVALGAGDRMVLGQHLGDRGALRARARQDAEAASLAALYGVVARDCAIDLHPDHQPSVGGPAGQARVVRVQHHLAHVLAVAAEHRVEAPFLGFAFDGLGAGSDGRLWGGEAILVAPAPGVATRLTAVRFATLRDFPLPGGEAAVREPRRAALGVAWERAQGRGGDVPAQLWSAFTADERRWLEPMLRSSINSPRTTSVGRLFDAVAGLLGICPVADYEGEAAMRLERVAGDLGKGLQSVAWADAQLEACRQGAAWRWNWAPVWDALVAAVASGAAAGELSAAFHLTVAGYIESVAVRSGCRRVLLSGGVFQNARLVSLVSRRLSAAGLDAVFAARVPPNDGALALGQLFASQRGVTSCA